MGFTVEAAAGRVLAIKAGKNNRTPVFVDLDELARAQGQGPHQVPEGGGRPRASSRRRSQGGRGGEDRRGAGRGARLDRRRARLAAEARDRRRHADPAADRRAPPHRQPLHAAQR